MTACFVCNIEAKKREKVDWITQKGLEWKKEYHEWQLLSESERRNASDELIQDFRDSITGAKFSGVFGNKSVLQREPKLAALYGTCDTPNTQITVNIQQMDGDFEDTLSTVSMDNNDWKVLFNEPMANGGNYTISIECPGCANSSDMDTLYDITFGDVYYCAVKSFISSIYRHI